MLTFLKGFKESRSLSPVIKNSAFEATASSTNLLSPGSLQISIFSSGNTILQIDKKEARNSLRRFMSKKGSNLALRNFDSYSFLTSSDTATLPLCKHLINALAGVSLLKINALRKTLVSMTKVLLRILYPAVAKNIPGSRVIPSVQ